MKTLNVVEFQIIIVPIVISSIKKKENWSSLNVSLENREFNLRTLRYLSNLSNLTLILCYTSSSRSIFGIKPWHRLHHVYYTWILNSIKFNWICWWIRRYNVWLISTIDGVYSINRLQNKSNIGSLFSIQLDVFDVCYHTY